MPPFGIIFPGAPQPQQNFVGQPSQNFTGGTKEFLPGSLEGGPFLPNPISQQPMLNQGPSGAMGTNEVSRFGVPLVKVGKSEQEGPEPVLGVIGGGQNIPLPPVPMTSDVGGTFETAPTHQQLVQTGNMFGMQQPGLRPVLTQDSTATPPSSSTSSLLGNFSGSNLDIFPTFLPMGDHGTTLSSNNLTEPRSTIMMVSPSVFNAIPNTSASSSYEPGSGGGGGRGGGMVLPIGTERAHKGAIGSGGSGPTSSDSGDQSSFPMLAPGEWYIRFFYSPVDYWLKVPRCPSRLLAVGIQVP